MSSVESVKTRLKNYLGYESPERERLRFAITRITDCLPQTAIFGGMLRDFALNGARDFASDIDLVTFATSKDIYPAIHAFSPVRNKFGGYRFAAGKWRFDIWAFEETWAFREGIVTGLTFTDLFKTTFFNLDAALFDLAKREVRFSAQYEEGVVNRLLEINLETNPSPARMAKRAIRLAIENDLSVGPLLVGFILSHTEVAGFGGLYEAFVKELERHVSRDACKPFAFRPQRAMEMP